jgi:hypothetical protein
MDKKIKVFGATILLVLMVVFVAGCSDEPKEQGPKLFESSFYDSVVWDNQTFEDYANENSEVTYEYAFQPEEGSLPESISLTLTWKDEDDYQRGLTTFENRPDEFGLAINFSGGNISAESGMATNSHGQEAVITLSVEIDHELSNSKNGIGTWTISVICGECEDKYANRPALLKYNDAGNDFNLDFEASVFQPDQGA